MKNFHFSAPACLAEPKENSEKSRTDTTHKGDQCHTIFMQGHGWGSAGFVCQNDKCYACIKREEFISLLLVSHPAILILLQLVAPNLNVFKRAHICLVEAIQAKSAREASLIFIVYLFMFCLFSLRSRKENLLDLISGQLWEAEIRTQLRGEYLAADPRQWSMNKPIFVTTNWEEVGCFFFSSQCGSKYDFSNAVVPYWPAIYVQKKWLVFAILVSTGNLFQIQLCFWSRVKLNIMGFFCLFFFST